MEAESNASSRFHQEEGLMGTSSNPSLNRHAVSFQSSSIASASEMIPMGLRVSGSDYFGGGGGGCLNDNVIMNTGCSSTIITNNPGISEDAAAMETPSSGSFLLDSVPGLKQDAGLPPEWTSEEQYKLEEGLVKYANEPRIMRYIKIAAMFHEKTVRDVALRCRWMLRKRSKPEEQNAGEKITNGKDKLVESTPKTNVSSPPPLHMAAYSLMLQHTDQSECLPFDGIRGQAKHLLEQNAQAFSQISANLSTLQLQDNIDLFCRTRNNIITMLNDMKETPGIMSQMPPLRVSINEDLANTIFPSSTQDAFYSRLNKDNGL